MIRGYARVSTATQGRDGNSLDAQTQMLKDHGAEVIYTDRFTGTKIDRPEFTRLLQAIRTGDTLIVCKLDRFARSVSQATDIITDLIDRGITVNVLNLGILSNDSMSTLMRNILLAFAQFERDTIVARTQEGKAVAKAKARARGEQFKEGRPVKYTDAQIALAMELLTSNSYNKVSGMTGISVSTLVRYHRKHEYGA